MIQVIRAALLAAAAMCAAQAASATPYFVTTGITTANTQIDEDHRSTWRLTLGAGATLDLGGGDFTIKRGNHTELPITLSLYEGTDASGLLVDSVSVLPAAVTQAYALVHFGFANPVALSGGSEGKSYFLALTSAADDAGSKQYFIKGEETNTLSFSAPSQTAPASALAAVPEPVSAGLLGVGLVGLGLAWRRRRARGDV